MTDRARELLERALEELIEQDLDLRSEFYTGGEWEGPKVIEEIRAYLAEPEVKREALTMRDVASQFVAPCEFDWHAFWDGIRFAEKHHGIGGRE